MSPYRILATDDKGTMYILSAIHSYDKKTGDRKILIVEKNFLPDVLGQPGWDLTSIAYRQITRKNSTIVGSYRAELNSDTLRRYSLIRLEHSGDFFTRAVRISGDERTLNSCMFNAMNDFCQRNSLTISRMF